VVAQSDQRPLPSLWIGAVVLAALVIRLAWNLSRPADDSGVLRSLPDQREYLALGRSLLDGRGLVFHDERLGVDVRAFRAPGYPAFIAACGGNVRAIRAAQSLLDTSTVLAVYLLARRWLNVPRSLVAAGIVALSPFLVYFSALILSETLFIAMLAWGMLLLSRRKTLANVAGLFILAMSVLVRPGAIALPAVLACVAALAHRHARRAAILTCAAIGLTFLVLLPWAWRNSRVIGSWVWTSTNSGFTLYDGMNPDARGASDQGFIAAMRQELRAAGDEVERSRLLARRALEYAKAYPGRALRLTWKKIARTWSPMPLSSEYGRDARLVAIALLYTVPLFVLTAIGLWRAVLPRSAKMYLMLPALYVTVAAAISVGSLRYRLPADVPMAVVAASALTGLTSPRERPTGDNPPPDV
jgi:4-amino-4-deoxy-L-arabinose transferase-like glycosyltransferase